MVEKTAAPAQGKGIFCKTITKSGLKLCEWLNCFICAGHAYSIDKGYCNEW
jgi:hypothetical protein